MIYSPHPTFHHEKSSCITPLLSSTVKKEASLPSSCHPKIRRGHPRVGCPNIPHATSTFSSSSWYIFFNFFYWLLNIKKRLLCWLYSKKLENKSFSQGQKDQGRRWIFFLVRSLEEGVLLSNFFSNFFRIKIRLNLIFNIKIYRKNTKKIWLGVWGILEF